MSGENIFGIAGLTPGGLGIWVGILGLGAWWIRGMADRKRADNEAIPLESKATDDLIELLRGEVRRLSERIITLELRVDEIEGEKRDVAKERDAAIAERNTALAESARLRAVNLGQGQARQDAATFVAMERAQDDAGKRGRA